MMRAPSFFVSPGSSRRAAPRGPLGTIPLVVPELYETLARLKATRDQKMAGMPMGVLSRGQKKSCTSGSPGIPPARQSGCGTVIRKDGKASKLFHDLRRTGVRNLVRAGVPET